MRTMGRLLLCSALAIMVFVFVADTTANASETRVGSMGGVGHYVKDDTNIFAYPGTFFGYAKMVVVELRQENEDATYTIGANMPIGEEMAWGIHLNRPVAVSMPMEQGDFSYVQVDRTTDLFFGGKGEAFNFGARVSVGLDSESHDVTEIVKHEESARYLALAAGVSNEMMDVGATVELPHAKATEDKAELNAGYFGFSLNGRAFLGESEETKLVPVGIFRMRSGSRTFDTGVTGVGKEDGAVSDLVLGLGIGVNHQINEDNLLVVGVEALGLNQRTTKPKGGKESVTRDLTMPGLYMGVETKLTSWLKGRMGGVQTFASHYTKDWNGSRFVETTTRASSYQVSFGLGFAVSKLEVDAMFNEGLLFEGPNFIGGGSQPLATRLSMIYRF